MKSGKNKKCDRRDQSRDSGSRGARQMLEERVAERTRMLQLLHDVTSIANEADTVQQAIQFVLARVAQHSGWCFGHAYLRSSNDPDELVLVEAYYENVPNRFDLFREQSLGARVRRGEGVVGEVFQKGEPRWDVMAAEETDGRATTLRRTLGIQMLALFPILVEDRVVGVLEFFSDSNVEPDQQILDSMASVGVQLGRILERKWAQKKLIEQASRIRSILDAAPDGILAIDAAGHIESFNHAAEGIFQWRSDEIVSQHASVLVGGSSKMEEEASLAELLTIPCGGARRRERELIGRRRDGSTFPMEVSISAGYSMEREVFTAIVRDVSFRKRLEREILQISMDEQQRIGQDLHDGIGQELTGLGYLARNLQERLESRQVPEQERAAELAEGLQHALNHVRMVAKELVPPELDAHSLAPVLVDYADNVTQLHDVPCRVEGDRTVEAPTRDAALHIYRLIQEAVTNAVKHAQARNIVIEIAVDHGRLRFAVRDDGVGIQEDIDQLGSVGLRTMSYRADLIAADLAISRAPEGGTIVTCTLSQEDSHGESSV